MTRKGVRYKAIDAERAHTLCRKFGLSYAEVGIKMAEEEGREVPYQIGTIYRVVTAYELGLPSTPIDTPVASKASPVNSSGRYAGSGDLLLDALRRAEKARGDPAVSGGQRKEGRRVPSFRDPKRKSK